MTLQNVQSGYTNLDYPYRTKNAHHAGDSFASSVHSAKKKQTEEKESSAVNEQTALTYQEILSEHIGSIREKLLSGNTEEKIQVGGEAMSIREWNLLIEGFDAVQEEILLTMRTRHMQQALEQKELAETAKRLTKEYHQFLSEQEELLEDELEEEKLLKESILPQQENVFI